MSRQNTHSRRRRKRSEEGAVMLIVMLILLTATAMAAASLQSTQYELRSAGYNRAALQTQYTSEAAANTTIAWVDATSMDGSFLKQISSWNAPAPQHAPNMVYFGEPPIPDDNRGNANRTQWRQQATLTSTILNVATMPPITRTGLSNDADGSFGPRSNYVAGIQNPDSTDTTPSDYVVDLYDCRQLPNTATGTQVNSGGSGTLTEAPYYCVMTSRGRAYVPGAPSKKWTMVHTDDYIVNRFTMSHDSRGTIITPPIAMAP